MGEVTTIGTNILWEVQYLRRKQPESMKNSKYLLKFEAKIEVPSEGPGWEPIYEQIGNTKNPVGLSLLFFSPSYVYFLLHIKVYKIYEYFYTFVFCTSDGRSVVTF
jgi:hypothetical protein